MKVFLVNNNCLTDDDFVEMTLGVYDTREKALQKIKNWVPEEKYDTAMDVTPEWESTELIRQVKVVCGENEEYNSFFIYSKEKWHYAEDYKELKEELEELSIDSLEEEDVDNMLSEFYDLCDIARVWLDF